MTSAAFLAHRCRFDDNFRNVEQVAMLKRDRNIGRFSDAKRMTHPVAFLSHELTGAVETLLGLFDE